MNLQADNRALSFDTLDWARIEVALRKSEHRQEDLERHRDRRLYCAACRHPITRERERIVVQGRHEHTYANPQGISYRIGCFAEATGCAQVGPASGAWSWFPGYRWQIAVCGGCGAHLGWRYTGGDHIFYGLILRCLVTETENR
jgi:hypothetical protein